MGVVKESRKPLKEVMAGVIANKERVLEVYTFIEPAFKEIEKDYSV